MIIGSTTTRVTSSMLGQVAIRNINQNMNQLLDLQQELSSGLRLYKPSADPSAAATTLSVQTLIEQNAQGTANISLGNGFLAATDGSLSNLQDVLNQARSIASTNIGAGSSDAGRQDAATVVSSLINQLTQLGNSQYDGRYLFGGSNTSNPPFSLSDSMVQFKGDNQQLSAEIDANNSVVYNVTAGQAFGSLSSAATSLVSLAPNLTGATRLSELNNGQGVHLGSIQISDGTNTTTVDLTHCDTVQNVVDTINNNGVVAVAASINAAGDGLSIAGGPLQTLSVSELPGGETARDLGILQTAPLGAGLPLVGQNSERQLSKTTELSALRSGLGIDQTHGLAITIGSRTTTIDLNGASTVEDLLNAINTGDPLVKASISSDGKLTIANTVASESMSIGENGGTTASDLGVRTLNGSDLLSTMNNGSGVRKGSKPAGQNDFEIKTSSGATIDVNIDGLSTVSDVLTAINGNAANAGKVSATLNPIGNGIQLVDHTGGGGSFSVAALNGSNAAADLGIQTSVAAGNPINGQDINPQYEQGIFQQLYALRDALQANDGTAISAAGNAIEGQISTVAQVRSTVGTNLQFLAQSQTRMQDDLTNLQGVLSDARDLDYASAVTQFQTLQTAYQASLKTAGTILPMTLMDYIQ